MRKRRGRTVEIETLEEFDRHIARGATSMDGWRLQAVDLSARTEVLRGLDPHGSLFLGCRLEDAAEDDLRKRGALLFPTVPEVPFDAYRGSLYTPEELYDGLARSYAATADARIYAWARQRDGDLQRSLARTLHDLAIDDALEEFVARRRMVGVMGGHALERGSAGYADAARLGRSLARAGLTVATGGGPGAMEAANLGAYLSGEDDDALDAALRVVAAVPAFRPSVGRWAAAAFEVHERWPAGADSLGIPTWFYGHEPPNPFATHIAKYFGNAIREDVLLHVCRAGIVFLPGQGGTVQEIFQDACENFYADASAVAPMVLVGTGYWTDEVPAWPLLESLARGREMAGKVALVDDLADVAPLLGP
ncbi:MAG: LOG family protein [Nocardioidaceae bacterium]